MATVMSAAASKSVAFNGVKANAPRASKVARVAAAAPRVSGIRSAMTGGQAKTAHLGMSASAQKGTNAGLRQRAAVVTHAQPKRGEMIVTNAGGAAPAAADDVPENVRFDMTAPAEKKRWAMIFCLFCAFVLCNLDKVNMSVAIVPMAQSFGWTQVEKGLVQSAFFWGYAFTQIPGGWLAAKFGGKKVLFWGVVIWSLGTLIAPFCAQMSFGALLASRFIVGLGEGVAPSAATGILAKGVPPSQRSRAVTSTFGGLDVGSLSGLIVAPPIIFYLGGWPAVFYLFGILGLIWGAWWGFSYMNEKSTDAIDTPEEIAAKVGKEEAPIPWGAFFSSAPFWALMVAHFTWNYFSYGLLAWMPSFLGEALNLTLSKSSFLAILPYLATVGVTLLVAPTAEMLEKKNILSRTNIRKLSQTLCFAGGAVCLSVVGFIVNSVPPAAVTPTTTALVLGFLSCAFGLGAWVRTGLFCGHQDLSPKYASIMLGVTNTAAAIGSVLSTFFTGYFLSITNGSWAMSLFLPVACLQLFSVLVFQIWKSDPIDFDAMAAKSKADKAVAA